MEKFNSPQPSRYLWIAGLALCALVVVSCEKDSGNNNTFTVDLHSSFTGETVTMDADDFTVGYYPTSSGLDSVIIEAEESGVGSDLKFLLYVDSIPAIKDTAGLDFKVFWTAIKGCQIAFYHPTMGGEWMHGEGGVDGGIKISNYDQTSNIVEGTFSGYIVKSMNNDTITFSNGSFRIDQ